VINTLAIPAINRILRRNSWALQRLQGCAGKTARIDCLPVTLLLTVLETGEIAPASPGAVPQVTIALTPGVMLRVLARDETVWNEIEVAGDTDFATVINHVWRNLRWDIEEDLARVFGDIAAHRMVQAGRTLDQWRVQSFDSLARSFAEYWTEERPLIARARDVERFNREVDQLRDDAARLDKRIENLLNRQGAKIAKKDH
jgi:ubiquinone biosynthesis protein UbiJ